MSEKITTKEIAAYLPYGLLCEVQDKGLTKIAKLLAVYTNGECVFEGTVESDKGFDSVKPILYPLKSIYSIISYNGEKISPLALLQAEFHTDYSRAVSCKTSGDIFFEADYPGEEFHLDGAH
jgi:hypothetical protein